MTRQQLQRRLSRTERERRSARRKTDTTTVPASRPPAAVADAEALIDAIDAALAEA